MVDVWCLNCSYIHWNCGHWICVPEYSSNLFGGILLLLQEPFRLGDFVRVIGIEGIVSDIQARATVVTAREGRQVVIPDATIFHQPRGRRPQSRNKPRTVTRDRS